MTFLTIIGLIGLAVFIQGLIVAPALVLGIAAGVGTCAGIFAFWYWRAGP